MTTAMIEQPCAGTERPTSIDDALDFELPTELEARAPAEERGLGRDDVRLMVSEASSGRIEHAAFPKIARFLEPGDLLVVNDSATMPAALSVRREDGTQLELHLSTRLGGELWTVESRMPTASGTKPFLALRGARNAAPPG